jgi:DNA-directed RNA polymerase specialized sigma24 family protein
MSEPRDVRIPRLRRAVRQNATVQIEDDNELRARYLASLDVLEDVANRATDALGQAAQARGVVRDHIAQGGTVSEIENLLEPEPLRASLSHALTELERARHEAQRLVFRLLYAEGRTMTDIGRTWGISRQLVSRLINEPEPKSESQSESESVTT